MNISYKGNYYNCNTGVQLSNASDITSMLGYDFAIGFIGSGGGLLLILGLMIGLSSRGNKKSLE